MLSCLNPIKEGIGILTLDIECEGNSGLDRDLFLQSAEWSLVLMIWRFIKSKEQVNILLNSGIGSLSLKNITCCLKRLIIAMEHLCRGLIVGRLLIF